MTDLIVPCVISFMPLIVTVTGWAMAFRSRRVEALHPFASTLLATVTAFAAIPVGTFIHYWSRPIQLPPWEAPEIAFDAWFCLLGPFCMVLGFLAFRKKPKWLFWVLEIAAFWLTGIGVTAIAAV